MRIAVVICALILVACSKDEPANIAPSIPISASKEPASQPAKEPQSQPTNSTSVALKIKGLAIGMDIQEASSAMKGIVASQHLDKFEVMDTRKVGDNNCVLTVVKGLKKRIYDGLSPDMEENDKKEYSEKQFNEILDIECSGGGTNTTPALAVWAGSDGKVNEINFNNFDDVFNAKGLPVAEFMQNFVNAYSIPEMKPNEDGTSWTYVSPDGSKVEARAVEIMGQSILAWIHISKVAGSNELKQGFN